MDDKFRSVKEIFADNFKIYRKQLNMTQAELAEALEISVNSVNNIENSKQFPNPSTIDKMIELCHLEPHQLFQEKDRMYYSQEQVNLLFQNAMGYIGEEMNRGGVGKKLDASYQIVRKRK